MFPLGKTFSSWFGWVSLFNGISTLFRLFNAKTILLEEQQWYYLTHSWEDKGVHTFPKGICPKVNVIARLEYKLVYYDSAVRTSLLPLHHEDTLSQLGSWLLNTSKRKLVFQHLRIKKLNDCLFQLGIINLWRFFCWQWLLGFRVECVGLNLALSKVFCAWEYTS